MMQLKDTSLDEYSSKLATLERESKKLQKELELLQSQVLKVRELERENKDLQQANIVEHQTLTAIRFVYTIFSFFKQFITQVGNKQFFP